VIRVAFTLLGGHGWLGGHHYLVNLLSSLRTYQSEAVTPVLFVSAEVSEEALKDFRAIPGVDIIRSPHFSRSRRLPRLAQALLFGLDANAVELFRAARIDVVFEPAQFYGWRLPMPAIAWIPDFQDRHLPRMFSRAAHLQKWLGRWTWILSRRTFMLSSEDARADCERFYPATRGRTRVVRFAVPPAPRASDAERAEVIARYGLPEVFFFLPNQFWRHKNHLCVVRALRLLKQAGHECVVAATGNSADLRHRDHFDHLRREVDGGGLTQNFRTLGVVPYRHVQVLMQSAAALINPSYCEGWSTTVEEAKSSGTPLILSDLNVHREQAAGSALFFNPDAPEQLAAHLSQYQPADARQRELLAAQARAAALNRLAQFAQEFSAVLTECLHPLEQGISGQ
jgi:glycosyltransferase involved in cell wall biosynthesis